jgi:hypothetical protein
MGVVPQKMAACQHEAGPYIWLRLAWIPTEGETPNKIPATNKCV